LTTLIGVALAYRLRNSSKGISLGIGFSAGIMLLISIFELVPESFAAVGTHPTLASALIGGLFVGSLDRVLPHTHLIPSDDSKESRQLKSAYLIAFGLILHDFPEGFAMANSYLINPSLGLLISIAIAAHNIPEEFAMSIPIIHLKTKRFLYSVAFLSGLSEPAGAVLGLAAASYMKALNPFLISFSAGAMIFVSLHELVPMSKKYREYLTFVLGILLSLVVYVGLTLLIPE
jgi:ZIP family zinc transporter